MTHNLLRKDGIPVLAAPDGAPFLQCTFQVKCDNLHASLSLQYNTRNHESTGTESFSLVYDADNLLSSTRCQFSTRLLSPQESGTIARNVAPSIRILSLQLRKPCPIIVPEGSCATTSQSFVKLAKSTKIDIAFDWKWLPPGKVEQFQSIVKYPERFAGFPIDEKNLKGRRLEDWTVFSPHEEDVVASTEPPSYAEVAHKRRRQTSNSPPQSPPPKRVYFIPRGSSTESDTASPPNRQNHLPSTINKPRCRTPSPADPSCTRSPLDQKFNRLAETTRRIPPGLEETVRTMMLNLFPSMFAHFIDHPRLVSSLSPSPSFTDTNGASTGTHSLHRIRSLMTACAAAHVEAKLDTILSNIEYDAHLQRQSANEEFLQGVAEEKLDIQVRKEDALAELGAEIDTIVQEKLVELDDRIDELIDEAGWLACNKAEDALDARAARCLHTEWNKALVRALVDLDKDQRVTKVVVRRGHAAGERKRKLSRFQWCQR